MGDKTENNLQLIHDPSSIYYLHPSEGPSNSLTTYLLKGENYGVWVKAVTNALEGRNKFGFINDEITKPSDEKSAEFLAWKSNNSTICSWLFNSVDESIQPSIVGHKIAKELWLDLKERYSIFNNGPRLNQLKSEYQLLRQREMSVVSYYNKFNTLWYELYGSEYLTYGCTCAAAAKLRARMERDKTRDFVLGLDDEQYSHLRTQILGMDPFPYLNTAFSLAIQEERHCRVKSEVVSFAAQLSSASTKRPPSRNSSGPPKCARCGRITSFENCCCKV